MHGSISVAMKYFPSSGIFSLLSPICSPLFLSLFLFLFLPLLLFFSGAV